MPLGTSTRILSIKSNEQYGTHVPGVTHPVHTVTVTFRVEGSADAATAAQEVVARFKEQEGQEEVR